MTRVTSQVDPNHQPRRKKHLSWNDSVPAHFPGSLIDLDEKGGERRVEMKHKRIVLLAEKSNQQLEDDEYSLSLKLTREKTAAERAVWSHSPSPLHPSSTPSLSTFLALTSILAALRRARILRAKDTLRNRGQETCQRVKRCPRRTLESHIPLDWFTLPTSFVRPLALSYPVVPR